MTPLLYEWHNNLRTLSDAWDKLEEATSLPADGPLGEALFRLTDHYTAQVSLLLNDEHEWLPYYQYHCDFGRNPAKVTVDGREILLDSLEKLEELIRA